MNTLLLFLGLVAPASSLSLQQQQPAPGVRSTTSSDRVAVIRVDTIGRRKSYKLRADSLRRGGFSRVDTVRSRRR